MNAALVMKSSCGGERMFPVRPARTLIGRESRCHVRIALPSVARRHCEIHIEDGSVHIRDLSSESGTFLNGKRIERAELAHDDELTIGPITFTVRMEQSASDAASIREAKPESMMALDEPASPEIVSMPSSPPQRQAPPPAAASRQSQRPQIDGNASDPKMSG